MEGKVLDVNIDKILPVADAKNKLEEIVTDVEGSDEMYVLTDNDKPSAVVVGVNHLEKLTGQDVEEVKALVDEKQTVTEPTVADTPSLNTEDPAEMTPVDVASTSTSTVEPTPAVAETPTPVAPVAPAPTTSPGAVPEQPADMASATIEPLTTPAAAQSPAAANAPTTPAAAEDTTKDDDLFV